MSTSIAMGLHPQYPTTTVQLSGLDQISPRSYIERLFCIELSASGTGKDMGEIGNFFALSLWEALTDFPCLLSEINISCPSRNSLLLQLNTTSECTLYIKNYTDTSLKHEWTLGDFKYLSSLGFPCSLLPRSLLLPVVPSEPVTKPILASYFQLNCIPGGLILGMKVHNSVCDMYGIGYFIRDWFFRLQALLHHQRVVELRLRQPASYGRDKLRGNIRGSLMDRKIWNAWATRPISFYAVPNKNPKPHVTPVWPVVWLITRESLSRLWKLYVRSAPKAPVDAKPSEISTNTLVTGCLWICINNARGLDNFGLNESILRTSVNLRKFPFLGLGEFYMGNACLDYNVNVKPLLRASSWPLSFQEALVVATSVIQNVSNSIDKADVKDILDWMEIRDKFEADTNLAMHLAPPDLKIHNQTALDISPSHWGTLFSQPLIRVTDGFDQGDCVFLSSTEDKQFEILTNLCEKETVKLAKYSEFREYFVPRVRDPAAD